MLEIINKLDALRSGGVPYLVIKNNLIKHIRADRFILTSQTGRSILKEWQLIERLR